MKYSKLSILFVLTIIFLCAVSMFAQKMKAEDVIAKHLDSIGTSEARAATKSQIAVGNAQIKFITRQTTPVVGRIVIAAAGEKNFWGMSLNSTDYPSDKFSYDGNKAKVGFTRTGFRSVLGFCSFKQFNA
jgi:amino acid permease